MRIDQRARRFTGLSPAHPARAVLLVHGYTDYFFHTELADHFTGRGFACS